MLRILLLGEFSALYKNLKEGLLECGCEVVTASSGDGYKKIPADIDFSSNLSGFFGKLSRKIMPLLNILKFKDFDVVLIINPFIFYHALFPNKFFYRYLKKYNKKVFFSGAGDDAYFWRHGRNELQYGPFDDFLKYDIKSDYYFLMSDKAYMFNKYLLDESNGLIPIMYEYHVSYKHENKCLEVIPIPLNLDKVEYKDNIVNDKIVIFHGLNRYGFKGTRHVEEAFRYLKKKYPNDLELIIDGGMPLHEYLKTLSKTNVVIDQLNSHSLGVNGVYSLAMGKVVIGGAEPIALECQNVTDSPVINVKPCSEDLIRVIESLLLNKDQVFNLGKNSRKYAENVHCHIKVAKKYLQIFENY
jgi:hypothetical protein